MNDDDLIWNSLSRREKESLGRFGLTSRIRKRHANQRSRERKRAEGLVRMEIDIRPEHRADVRKLVALYSAARNAGEALRVMRVPMLDGGGSAVLEGEGYRGTETPDQATLRDDPGESSPCPPVSVERPERRSSSRVSQNDFFSDDYSTRLTQIIAEIVETDGPLPLELLRRKVARLHGWHRAGGLISARIDACLRAAERHDEAGTPFVWAPATRASRITFRAGTDRDIREISRHELADLFDRNAAVLKDAVDPARECARLAGVGRLTPAIRAYLEGCLAWWPIGDDLHQAAEDRRQSQAA
ncbi:DUF3320 domain-containing protein [Paracoccus sp. S-4012]|uniref:DUF3320 domain-containing protein n=1 Tax=Paracoccus sp. S-4012 TaxID=2665648 RepID=UPI0018A2301A|nr:DUF3320 domain-containing protein [Paracoccus sp. S-4012]